jgi:hypothetical protein
MNTFMKIIKFGIYAGLAAVFLFLVIFFSLYAFDLVKSEQARSEMIDRTLRRHEETSRQECLDAPDFKKCMSDKGVKMPEEPSSRL